MMGGVLEICYKLVKYMYVSMHVFMDIVCMTKLFQPISLAKSGDFLLLSDYSFHSYYPTDVSFTNVKLSYFP